MPDAQRSALNLRSLREKLSAKRGEEYWRSLEELADTEEFRELLSAEFPRQTSVWDEAVGRRRFLQLMGASLALAGLSSCTKQPDEEIVPYVRQPEILIPGKPLYYATAMLMGGMATGIIVTSNMGRPTKIEGNPVHPASLGATDAFAQASILALYDPDRSQVIRHNGEISTWSNFLDSITSLFDLQKSIRGAGIRLLTETMTSPTFARQWDEFREQFPEARWHQYEPVNLDAMREGSRLAFGGYYNTCYEFANADVVLSLDSNFFADVPGHVRYARDFADRRRIRPGKNDMNRLYVAEACPTITGMMADHRLRARTGEIENIARALAGDLGIEGVDLLHPIVDPKELQWIRAGAEDLAKHRGSSLVLAGPGQPPIVHALVHAMNFALQNQGKSCRFTDPVEANPASQSESLASLLNDIEHGEVDILLMIDGNPVYNAPADLDVARRFSNVKNVIRLSMYEDESSAIAHWHIPQSHYLETWSDARSYDGTATIMQPLIEPLYFSKSIHEFMGELLGHADSKGYDIVRRFWEGRVGKSDIASFWQTTLNNGFVARSASPNREVQLNLSPGLWQVQGTRPASEVVPQQGFELSFKPDPTIWDGRFANNGWLQELPKPITKLSWDNAALMSPSTAEQLDLSDEDVVTLNYGGRSVDAAVVVVPGHADAAVTVHLGYGRSKTGHVGKGAGFNAFLLRELRQPWFGSRLEIRKTGRRQPLALTQKHHNMEGRNQIRVATLEQFIARPAFAKAIDPVPPQSQSLYQPYTYDRYAWGMSIDLNACTGCNACVIACQSENNIPIVGKEQVRNSREMQWIRIDTYFKGDLDNPEMYNQPVPCMHCESAPCELVCPVGATVHDSEGLNVMVYNRCVGTRYCSNNCPYKVRRFNFLEYNGDLSPTMEMSKNPDVTVRSRGVMEKCSYCIQRINESRSKAEQEDRPIRDGEVVTACQAACPARAIVFGNTNDGSSAVSLRKAEPRDYSLLAELNTKPRTTYLAKLRNPNPAAEGKG